MRKSLLALVVAVAAAMPLHAKSCDTQSLVTLGVPEASADRIVRAADLNAGADGAFPTREDILSIAYVESNFNPSASNQGNYGLMQVNSRAHKLSRNTLLAIESNVREGARVLKEYYALLRNNPKSAVAAYNVGPAKVKSARGAAYYRKYLKAKETLCRNTPTAH